MKRIIICCDGTWNEPGKHPTNVQRIFEAISPKGKINIDDVEHEIDQISFYIQGVGTAGLMDKYLGGFTGQGIDDNIIEAYKFLIGNYCPGDQIYLFGFSRGAYTARSLAGLIRNCGILKPTKFNHLREAYDMYRHSKNHPESENMIDYRRRFALSDEVPIRFIGVWDTVGALGIPARLALRSNMKKYQFHDVKLSSKVEFAYHALAIDERRSPFKPTLWELSDTVKKDPNHKQVLEQVWFPGVHSDIGGGYPEKGLCFISLLWLLEKAEATGLGFNPVYKRWIKVVAACQQNYMLHNEESFMYKVMLNIRNRRIDDMGWKKQVRHEILHSSLDWYKRVNNKYKPKNVTSSIVNWLPHTP